MEPTEFIQQCGYAAIAIGTFFEGETIMLAAGMAVAAGWLNLPAAIGAGMAGVFASDTLCFFLGRLAAPRLARWFPRWHARLGPAIRLIERHDEKAIVFFQFFPGLCTVTPMAFGMTRISAWRFMALDALGNAIWTLTFSIGGYLFGAAFAAVAGELHFWLGLAFATALIAILGVVGWRARRALFRRLEM